MSARSIPGNQTMQTIPMIADRHAISPIRVALRTNLHHHQLIILHHAVRNLRRFPRSPILL